MRICVLNSSYERSESAFKGHDPAPDPARWLPDHEWEQHGIHKATAVREVHALVRRGFDVFVNLCDGAWDEDRAGVEVVQTLERLGAAFTGAGERFYDPSRETMKRVCHYAGIGAPGWAFASDAAGARRAAAHLRFPMIVKHANSYGSIGMGRDARVETVEALVARAEHMAATYGDALIEEFIEGREFTVLVAEAGPGEPGPRTYAPLEFLFPAGETFKHFDLKWVHFAELGCRRVDDAELSERLRSAAAAMFSGIAGSGYARCDLRMDARGALFMLEINPNCGVFYPSEAMYGSADFILQHDRPDGAGHVAFLAHIIERAFARQARSRPRWRVAHSPGRGFGMVASEDIMPGQVIVEHEGRSQPIVSKRHVQRNWDSVHRDWFDRYAWPLSDELYGVWSDDPAEWRPIDHSCDPSAWLEGLDLVARRKLVAGYAITMDYATFCGDGMRDFDCHCGSSDCRGVVRGADHRAPWLEQRYGHHISDWVRARRAKETR